MPPTRRNRTSHLKPAKKITRRRIRTTTWLDLLQAHSGAHNSTTDRSNGIESNQDDRPTKTNRIQKAQASASSNSNLSDFAKSSEEIAQDSHFLHLDNSPTEDDPPVPYSSVFDPDMAMELLNEDAGFDCQSDTHEDATERCAPRGEEQETATADLTSDIARASKLALHPSAIIALTLLCGSVRFSVQQYELVRTIVRHAETGTELPSYSTVKRKLLPHFLKNCFAQSTVKRFRKKHQHLPPEVQQDDIPTDDEKRYGAARVIYPTEWAKTDVSSLPFYRNVFCRSTPSTTSSQDPMHIENAPIIRSRSEFLDVSQHLFVDSLSGRVPARAKDQVRFKVRGTTEVVERLLRRNQFEVTRTEQIISVSGFLQSSWCVSGNDQKTPSARNAIHSVPDCLRDLVSQFALSTAFQYPLTARPRMANGKGSRQRFFTDREATGVAASIRAGDICTLMGPNRLDHTTNMYCIIVSRFWKAYQGTPSQIVIWVQPNTRGPNAPPTVPLPTILFVQPLVGTPFRIDPRNVGENSSIKRKHTNMGCLEDGRPYVVYRAMLYCDDFQQSSTPYSANAAGGVYLLPMGLSLQARKSRTAVRIVSLTPPGVSTNEVLLDIIPDIVKGSTTGVEGFTPDGKLVVIFIDILGYIADYPASAAPLDIIGHTGDSPCTHCSIRKVKAGSQSALGFTTEVHAMNTAGLRCGERNRAIRDASISSHDANVLGMKPNDHVTDTNCPLIALQRELEAARTHVTLNQDGEPTVPASFDAFRSNMIAPDHLLTGLVRNVMNLFFHILSPKERLEADIAICTALERNGLARERSIYNERKGQLHSMSLTSLYCVSLVAYPVLTNFMRSNNDIRDEVLHLIQNLQNLINTTMRSVPARESERNGHSTQERVKALQKIAIDYVSDVNEFCRKYGEKGKILDKPNLHRLLELFHHTIPAFGHVCHVLELVFEAAHQPLKRCISRGNHHEAEVSAVEHCIGNDWQSRVALLQHLMEFGDEEEQRKAMCGLRRLLIGDTIQNVDMNSENGQRLMDDVDNRIRALFNNVVKHILKTNGNASTALGSQSVMWVLQGERNLDIAETSGLKWDIKGLMERGKRLIKTQKKHFGDTETRISSRTKAKRVKTSAMRQWATSYPWEALESEMIMEAPILPEEKNHIILRPQETARSQKHLFVVIGFLEGASQGPWAVCVPVQRSSQGYIITPDEVRPWEGRVVQLNDAVRKAAVYHACDHKKICRIDVDRKRMTHGERIFSGGIFRVQCPLQGYPPRMA